MWGTRHSRSPAGHPIRFIPTHVGNTDQSRRSLSPASVHPHACGEHLETTLHLMYAHGSSPRMWGTLVRRSELCPAHRFIPTHVGNTRSCSMTGPPRPVHPHACGEHSRSRAHSRGGIGSSPRMWGTRLKFAEDDRLDRFIPTHVGNTPGRRSAPPEAPVHPHACGEHRGVPRRQGCGLGSSPRMWGTLRHIDFVIYF